MYAVEENRVQMWDKENEEWSVLGTEEEPYIFGTGLGQFYLPSGIAVDSDGNVFVGDTNNNRVQKWDKNSGQWSQWGITGTVGVRLGEFHNPNGVAVDAAGNVYVADTQNQRIQKLNIATNKWSQWGDLRVYSGVDLGEFNGPNGIAVHAGGIFM